MKLNESGEAYKVYEGENTKEMPKLIADGRVTMSVARLMLRRLEARSSDVDLKTSYLDNYFDTGDAVVYHPDGRVKIALDSRYIRDVTPGSLMNGGALVLTEDAYNSLNGEEFKKGKLGKTGGLLSKVDVKAHPAWKVLARDQRLLNDYTDFIFAEGKQRYGYDNAMCVLTTSANRNTPEMRVWYVDGFEDGSNANGRGNLGNNDGRFVGIASEVLSTSDKKGGVSQLEKSLTRT